MRISDIMKRRGQGFSFEFFPPKTEEGESRLFETIGRLEALGPNFVSVTYGAGGGTRKTTRNVVERILRETSLTPMPHLTCVGQTEAEIREILRDYERIGVENILALRGDPPVGLTELPESEYYAFSIGVAVYPESHVEAPSEESDLYYAKRKIEAGADFAITQMVFDNRLYYDFVERAAESGIHVPIIPGVMPITDIGKIKQFSEMCGATLPSSIVRVMEDVTSPEDVRRIGIDFATRQCVDLWEHGVRFFHFYALNRADVVSEVLTNLSLEGVFGETPSKDRGAHIAVK
jgi:methylenetetrahydrofolate reductase (NADPH)